jgi:hypothetical protein
MSPLLTFCLLDMNSEATAPKSSYPDEENIENPEGEELDNQKNE